MAARIWLTAGAATVLLAAGSVAALAVVRPHPAGPGPAGCAAPSLPGQQVHVVLSDGGGMGGGMSGMGGAMMGGRMVLGLAPRTVAAGTVSIVATDRGSLTHEVVVLPLADGQPAGSRAVGPDGVVDETGSLGEASRSCGAGQGKGISPGRTGWVTLTLAPGRYELLCNEPGHYAAGMHAELDVA